MENAETYDPSLERGAAIQMVDGGWMHNYVRMYWAKKGLGVEPQLPRRHTGLRCVERQI